ncbi:5,6-dimethylbenzimidazole synthase [Sulfurimonas autotrophica]|uniref:Cob(II)yrinic acid a,c-diamide reductase n=1 Tax=Sulfurimonas autotrophica (strain ATCC BAA-671 / DSM 16294 / JCM 11897 / OK10) TaxID=563040 RepID=E0UT98_SULAO|nr:5,6-dimethylbenzimidazole synthase [Sulfurimonas autotrophica]ADN08201.1 cob(II)yrinic acid a,c-diamide reductase [Sulfurimonas autotrophica DSM 16294]
MEFNTNDTKILLNIMKNRRDVRGNHFLNTEIEDKNLQLILEAALTAPSVGYSQPWKFIVIKDENIKEEILNNFQNENEKAKEIFKNKNLYQKLKLEGIKEAPINIVVLYDESAEDILGMTSMKSMGEYSVVCVIQNMWLMARALNIGLGWVSILNEQEVLKSINAPKETKLIAYLCVGYVDEFFKSPELKMLGWEEEKKFDECVSFI